MTAAERIERMKAALTAAEAVQAEIERRNDGDSSAFRVAQREPVLQRAIAEVRDTRRKIRDLEAAQLGITLPPEVVDKLEEQAARLNAATRANALVDLAMASLTTVLNGVTEVRGTLA